MTRYAFNGASDDLIEFSVDGATSEQTSYADGPVMAHAHLVAPDGTALTVTLLLVNETWHGAVGQTDEETPLPPWPITVRQAPHCDYATEIVIDAPDGTDLTWALPV